MLEMDAQSEGYKISKKDRRSGESVGETLYTGVLAVATLIAALNYSPKDGSQNLAYRATPTPIVEPDRLPSHPDIHKVSSSAGAPTPFE